MQSQYQCTIVVTVTEAQEVEKEVNFHVLKLQNEGVMMVFSALVKNCMAVEFLCHQ